MATTTLNSSRLLSLVIAAACIISQMECTFGQDSGSLKVAADFYRAGQMAVERKNYERAVEHFTKAIVLAPDFLTAIVERGDAYVLICNYDKALADYDAAIKLNQDDPGGYFGRGRVYHYKKDYTKAVDAYNEAIRRNPEYPDFYDWRGMAFRKLREYEKAIVDYTRALELAPNRPGVLYNRGNAYKANGNYAKAIADFNEAIRLDPKDALAHNNLALLLACCPERSLRDQARALKLATTACELTEWKDMALLDTLAVAHAANGQFVEAVKWAEKAFELAPPAVKPEIRSHIDLFMAGKPYQAQ